MKQSSILCTLALSLGASLLFAPSASAATLPAQAEEVTPPEPTATITSDPPAPTPTESNPPPDETPPPTEENPHLPPADRCTNLDGPPEIMPAGFEDPDGDKVCTQAPPPPLPQRAASTKTWAGLLMLGHRCSGKGTKVLGGRVVNENTPAACRQAFRRGADGGEWDLQLCDRSFHDSRLDRMTTSRGSVAKCRRTYRARLNRTGRRIPSGSNMLSSTYGRFSEMNVKVRTPLSRVEAHVRYAGRVMDQRKLIVTSSELNVLERATRTSKSVHTNLLSYSADANCMSLARLATRSYVDGILVHYRAVTRQCVQYMHGLGKTIRVWAVRTADQFSFLKRIGVDGMITGSMWLVGKE
jgi:glycerophosphoryl diester phosphodiesterase